MDIVVSLRLLESYETYPEGDVKYYFRLKSHSSVGGRTERRPKVPSSENRGKSGPERVESG